MTEPLDIRVTGESSDHHVNVTFAHDEVASVHISRTLIDPQRQAELERSVREAVNAALAQYTAELQQAMGSIPGEPPQPEEVQRLQASLDELLARRSWA